MNCRKRTYTKAEAKKAARRTETYGRGAKVGRMNVYRCGDCGRWHIGHPWDGRPRRVA